MSMINCVNRTLNLGNKQHSSNSSDTSEKNNRDRMREFKALSTKRNSVMEHLMHYKEHNRRKSESTVTFQSEKWTGRLETDEKSTNIETSSCKLVEDNPFLRAKQSILNKSNNSPKINKSSRSIGEEEEITFEEGQITTLRVFKKGSLNTPITQDYIK